MFSFFFLPPFLLPTLLPMPLPTTVITPLISFVLYGRWKNVQEASSSLREGASRRGVEASGRVRASMQEGVVEGLVLPYSHPQQRL